ncbi:unnamed protein product, partial [marine sediment metagenome]
NSLLGAASTQDGSFVIYNVPLGTHVVLASYIGYGIQKKTVRIGEPGEFTCVFKLEPKTLEMTQVIVTPKRPKNWNKNLKTFEKEFLGSTRNAKKCEILNAEILSFTGDRSSGFFSASADGILKVRNNALGYMVDLHLEEFNIQSDILTMKYIPHYEELIPKDKKQELQWQKERKRAYYGSIRHLLTALAFGVHEEEGFILKKARKQLFTFDFSEM